MPEEMTLELIERDHWLAGHETTGGLRRQQYGSIGWAQVAYLLAMVSELQQGTAPRNRKERRAARKR